MATPAYSIQSEDLGYYACGGKEGNRDIINCSSALELFHSATLIHDDIIDQSPYRRGKQSAHLKYSISEALTMGRLVMVKGFELVKGVKVFFEPDIIFDMINAELEEGYAEHNVNAGIESYLSIINGKTATLMRTASSIGAGIAGASSEMRVSAEEYGYNLGMAFQITDDLLDLISTEAALGKSTRIDVCTGKFTLPILLAFEDASKGDKIKLQLSNQALSSDSIECIINDIMETDAIERSLEMAEMFISNAIDSTSMFSDSVFSESLRHLAKYVVDRVSTPDI